MNLTLNLPLIDILGAQLWQVSLLILVIALLHRCFAKDRPHLAHVLWVLVLLKCVTPPIVGSPASPFSWLEGRSHASIELDESARIEVPGGSLLGSGKAKPPTLTGSESIVVRAEHVSPSEFAFAGIEQATANNSDIPKASEAIEKGNLVASNEVNSDSLLTWFLKACLVFWIIGLLVSFGIACLRWLAFRRWIGRSQVVEAPHATQVTQRLTKELGINRSVRLLVMQCSVGPAVIGLFRPTILLPEAMVEGRTPSELEPILAHELIHVRRGDLWWSLLQTVSKSLFWFNPLVWWASSMVTRESERSCDEETVASLACSPRHYANSLIDVLELKHRLRVAPAVPGVRPIDITSARLERVMRLGNGCQHRTPIWMWAVFLLGCCVALPGASLAWSQQLQKPEDEKTKTAEQGLQEPGSELVELSNADSNLVDNLNVKAQSDEIYYFPPRPESKLNRQAAALTQASDLVKTEIGTPLPRAYYLSDDTQFQPETSEQQKSVDEDVERKVEREVGDLLQWAKQRGLEQSKAIASLLRELSEDRFVRGMNIEGTKLVFFATDKTTNQIDKTLKRWREFGFDSVVLKTRFVTLQRETVNDLGLEWRFGEVSNVAPANLIVGKYQLDAVHLAGQLENPDANPVAAAAAFSSGNRLTMVALADDEQLKKLLDQWKGDATSSLRQMATVFAHSGQEATIRCGAEHPFVVGMKKINNELPLNQGNLQPIVQLVNDGVTVEQFPVVNYENGSVQVILNIETAEVLEVDTVEMPIAGGVTVQQPKIERSSVLSDVTIPKDKRNAVICYFDKNSKGEEVAELVVVSARVVTFEARNMTPIEEVFPNPTHAGKAYAQPLPISPIAIPPDFSTTVESHALPDFQIVGVETETDAEVADRHQQIEEWMENFDFKVSVSGDVDFHLSEGDNVGVIHGKKLRFSTGDGETLAFSGDQGAIRLKTHLGKPELFEFEFAGSTKARIYGSEISADSGSYQVEMDGDDEISEWRFYGCVEAVVDGVTLSCDSLHFIEGDGKAQFKLSGKAKLTRETTDSDSISLSGEGIHWDVINNRFQSFTHPDKK